MTVAMRAATEADLGAIVALLADDALGATREAAGPTLDPRYRRAFAAIARDPNQMLAVAEAVSAEARGVDAGGVEAGGVDAGGAVVGCLQVSIIPGLSRLGATRGQIEGVRVAGAMRGSGTGRAMIEWAIALCRGRGCDLVQLTSDKARPDAHRFYASLGFSATHEGFKLALS